MLFGYVIRRRGPIDDLDVGMRELFSLIEEGVEWCERPVANADDAPLALDFIERATAVLVEAERVGLWARDPLYRRTAQA